MSPQKEHFSDEILNAYIDGELEAEDCARIDTAMQSDDFLRRRVSDLQQISGLVRAAFEDVSPPEVRLPLNSHHSPSTPVWQVAAIIAFAGLGALLGWHMIEHQAEHRASRALVAADYPTGQSQATTGFKVMFHIGRRDSQLFETVLDEADRLLSQFDDPDRPVSVSVIASHGGLSLFEASLTGNAERVRRIKQKFENQVDFVGCGETYKQWQKNKSGSPPHILQEMLMVDSGVMELLRRQQQGWTFVSI